MSKNSDRIEAISHLREMLNPGDTVTTQVMHVSPSGMSRTIQCEVIAYRVDNVYPMKDGRTDYDAKPIKRTRKSYIADITHNVAVAIGARYNQKHGGVVMGGCGMDMCFAAVYDLGRTLFPYGFGVEGIRLDGRKVRPKTKAGAARMVKNGVVFRGRNGDATGWDDDGGCALRYR